MRKRIYPFTHSRINRPEDKMGRLGIVGSPGGGFATAEDF
jgi:hypothetical protein